MHAHALTAMSHPSVLSNAGACLNLCPTCPWLFPAWLGATCNTGAAAPTADLSLALFPRYHQSGVKMLACAEKWPFSKSHLHTHLFTHIMVAHIGIDSHENGCRSRRCGGGGAANLPFKALLAGMETAELRRMADSNRSAPFFSLLCW